MKRDREKLGSREAIKTFYDRLGGLLDTQRFFKEPALKALLAYSDFESARFVYELGCGTGRLAEKILLANSNLHYQGVDISSTMVHLSQKRLQRFGLRTSVTESDGTPKIPLPNGAVDRFVATYVFDLMSKDEIKNVLSEVQRILNVNGKVCLLSLTNSTQWFGRLLTSMWLGVHQVNPMILGGCRPIELTDFIPQHAWRIQHCERISRFGLTSEVLIADRITGS